MTAKLTVVRLKGRFSVATVDWTLIGQSSKLVLRPYSGTLVFPVGQQRQTIDIEITGTHVIDYTFHYTFHFIF